MDFTEEFYGVFFPKSNDYAVVPKNWMHKKNGKNYSYWPNEGVPETLAKEKSLHLEGWGKFKCDVLASASEFL